MSLAIQPGLTEVPSLPLWARLLAAPYGWGAAARAACYRQGIFPTRRLPRRVISVGNLTVGGTGKTPVVIWIVQQLLAQGRRVAVLSRGYRRTSRADKVLVSDGHSLHANPAEGGDEPFLIARRCPRAIVGVGADRHAVGQWLLERFAIDDFVLDDGFQHMQLARDINILLLDASDPAGLAGLLPMGRLRESLAAAERATDMVMTRVAPGAPAPGADAIRAHMAEALGYAIAPIPVEFSPEALVHIMKGQTLEPGAVLGRSVVAVSAIGNPAAFERTLVGMGVRVSDHVVFRDHHAYSALDITTVQRRADACRADLIVTTEKDACKLAVLLGPSDPWWALRVQAQPWPGDARLAALLAPSNAPDSSRSPQSPGTSASSVSAASRGSATTTPTSPPPPREPRG